MNDPYREPIEQDIDLRRKFLGVSSHENGAQKHADADAQPEMGTPVARPSAARERRGGEKDSSMFARIAASARAVTQSDDDDADAHRHTVARDAHTGASQPTVKEQVRHLIALAQSKGVPHAVRVARRMSNYYVMDTLHDKMLTDAFYEELRRKGML